MFSSRFHSYVFLAIAASVIASPLSRRQTTDGDNNGNSGDIFNGDSTTFSLTNGTDISGGYNVGANNTFGLDNSTLSGNNQKRQTTTPSNNNGNSGNITNGDATTFGFNNVTDVTGGYNVGSDDIFGLSNSTLAGNTQKRQTTTPSNNNGNSGNITNGDTTTFGFTNVNDASGGYNVGSGDSFDLLNSTLTGNTESSAKKRQTTTTDGDNNTNSGNITVGDTTSFGLNGVNDASGGFNVGHNNGFNISDSTLTGNNQTASARKRQTTTGDNNTNSGNITVGDATTFGLDNVNDASGGFNVGHSNGFNLTDSNIIGNNQTASARKRQTTTTGDNNTNSGNITVGDATTFGLDNVTDASGGFNVGHDNIFGLTDSTLTGNNQTTSARKRQTTSTDGDNNTNSGNITVGDTTGFTLDGSNDVSGGFNVGSNDTATFDNSSLTGNTEGSARKRQTTGDNNDNQGSIVNGTTTSFTIGNSTDVSGEYNVGSGNSLVNENSTVTGNTQ